MNFSFDSEKHLYTYNGRPVPSTTQVIRTAGIGPDFSKAEPGVLEHRRALGSAVHACLHFMQEQDLDPESIDQEVLPYLVAQKRFVLEHKFEAVTVEQPRVACANGLPYGMTPDNTGLIKNEPWLVDYKITKGSPHPSWGVQVAAYANGFPAPLVPPFKYRRASVQLSADGSYHFEEFKDPGDIDEFKAALFLTWRKINRGAKPWEDSERTTQ